MPRRSSCKHKVELGKNVEEIEMTNSENERIPDKKESDSDFEEREIKPEEGISEPGLYCEESEIKTAVTSESLVPLYKRKRRRKKVFVIDKEEEALPTYTRKTNRGGYSHTNLSRSRISKANSGNKPWNLGKRRSSADKAKIAAGVRARNRTILLQKLKRLGLTEEEYNVKKKEIKYLRERIRRAKLANGKHRDQKMEKKLQDAIDATNVKNVDPVKDEKNLKEEQKVDVAVVERKDERATVMFSKEITWRPLSSCGNDCAYDQSCPEGGPGGLICCDSCSTNYNVFLTTTLEDVETHRMIKEAGEVTEILEFLGQKKEVLKNAVDSAKTKIPPLPPPGSGRLTLRQEPHVLSRLNSGNRKSGVTNKCEKPEFNHGAWNLTSSIDIGVIGGFASV